MFVAPKMMGRGIGRTLIERAKKEAAALAIKRLTIQGDANATDSCAAAGGS